MTYAMHVCIAFGITDDVDPRTSFVPLLIMMSPYDPCCAHVRNSVTVPKVHVGLPIHVGRQRRSEFSAFLHWILQIISNGYVHGDDGDRGNPRKPGLQTPPGIYGSALAFCSTESPCLTLSQIQIALGDIPL